MKKKFLSLILALAMVLPLCPAFDIFAFAEGVVTALTVEENAADQSESIPENHVLDEESDVVAPEEDIASFSETIKPTYELDAGSSQSGTTGSCTWTLDGSVLTISGKGAMKDYPSLSPAPWGTSITKVIIKDGVTSIGEYAFCSCSRLTSVTIPDSVTSIGRYAFWGCSSLASVTIGNGVRTIGDSAFSGCTSLTSVTIPDSVTSIGNHAFDGCSRLASVTIPDSVTSIGGYAFYGCTSLTSVTIPDSVTSINTYAFSGCSSLRAVYISDLKAWCEISFGDNTANPVYYAKNLYLNGEKITDLVIPQGITKIGFCAFSGCSRLASVTIPDSVTSIGNYAFWYCTSLTSVTIGNGVKTIGSDAFRYCSSLTSVTIPDSVTSIGNYAFDGCSSLTSVDLGTGVETIGSYAFSNCTSLTSVTIPDSVTSIGQYAFSICRSLTSITIGNGVKTIGVGAFVGCSMTEITIPDSVTSIGSGAFFDCSSLTSITIPDSVTSIGSDAFRNCTSLTSVTIPDSVTSIGYDAFDGCSSLTEITIPDSVTSIGSYAFEDCTSLSAVYISDLKAWCEISFSDYYANPVYYAKNLYLNGEKITDLVIPQGTTKIGSYAFYGCSSLASVAIPDSVTSIGSYAFKYCTKIATITIPDSVTSIGYGAFEYCSSLTSVTIPDSVTSIGEDAFNGCSSLTSVTIGNGVTAIGSSAFSGCSSLTSVTIPDSVTSIGGYAFEYCTSLTSVTIPDSVTSIGYGAFSSCSSLTSVTIPDSVTSIGESAFDGCSTLTDVWYEGTEADQANISIGSANEKLTNATWHYNSCTKNPAENKVHTYDDVCDDSCNLCSAEREVPHVYDNVCDSICNVCGYERTVPDHTYDNDCDTTCNVCGVTRTTEHYTLISASNPEHTTKNSTAYPFTLSNGWYQSTNKANSSSSTYTITATHTCNLVLTYKVSSEAKYDKLIIKKNSTELDNISGSVSEKTLTVNLVAGDQLTFTYSKDGSQSAYSDCGWFKFSCDCNMEESVLSSTLEPTCTEPVVCSICGTVVKEAIGHSYTNNCDPDCNRCREERTVPDHVYSNNCDTTCNECGITRTITHDYTVSENDPETHWTKCSVCSTIDESSREAHIYDNICDSVCNKCSYEREVEPHFVFSPQTPHTLKNSTSYPFSLSNDWYTSTNKSSYSSSTFVLEAVHNCSLVIQYKVSSEQNYDKLIIKQNSTTLATISGSVSGKTLTVNLVAGDQLTFTYSKDSYGYSGSDTASFKIGPCSSCKSKVFEESIEAICGEIVTCSGCGIELEAASIIHVNDDLCNTTCSICGAEREAPHNYPTPCFAFCPDCGESRTPPHEYDNACDTTCNGCGVSRSVPDHVYDNACDTSCNVCSATRSVPDHVYDHTCDTICNECGYERTITHAYTNACDTACDVCRFERVPPHEYSNVCDTTCNGCGFSRSVPDHVYDNACDAFCNECENEREVPEHVYDNVCDTSCNVCSASRIAPHEHDNICDTTCNLCSAVREVPDHVFEGNTCSECGFRAILIRTKEELNSIRSYLNGYYLLANDIVFTDADFQEGGTFAGGWNPIGSQAVPFSGTLNGNGFAIANLQSKATLTASEYIGLFGVNNGKIRNLTMKNAKLSATFDFNSVTDDHGFGIIAGENGGLIENCVVDAASSLEITRSISGESTNTVLVQSGGIVGKNTGTVRKCVNRATVSSHSLTGGIAGQNEGTISSCRNEGTVVGSGARYSFAGGIVSRNFGMVEKSSNVAAVSTETTVQYGSYSYVNNYSYIGGIVSENIDGAIIMCYNTGAVSSTAKQTPGVSGSNLCRYSSYGGGIAGDSDNRIENCYNTASIFLTSSSSSSTLYAGGITGYGYSSIEACYNLGAINTRCSWTDGKEYHGGIAAAGSFTLQNCYYASDISDKITGGVSRQEMKKAESFSGFDFDRVWTMTGNKYYSYPELLEVEVNYSYTPGDLDGVEGITLDDAIYLLYYVNFPEKYPVNQPVDFDSSGKEDLDDAIYLLYHVNFPGNYPLK